MISGNVLMVLLEIQNKERENQNVHHKCGVRSLANNPEKKKKKTIQSLLTLAPSSSQESHDCSEPPNWELSWLERLWKSEITIEDSV